jgi:hypothetical protein
MNISFGIFVLQIQHLGYYEVRAFIIDFAQKEHNAFLKETRVDIEKTLLPAVLADNQGGKHRHGALSSTPKGLIDSLGTKN